MDSPRRFAATAAALLAVGLALPAGAGSQDRAERLRIPLPRDDGSLTPYTFRLGYPFVSLIYDTIALRDANGVPRPWLARSIRRSGLRVTIELRRGVRWQDGSPLTAADVAFTFAHFAARPHPRFTPQLRDVRSAEATGRHTVVVTLRRPSLGFVDQPLADLPILPAHLWRGLPASRLAPAGLAVGSGPYRLVEYRKGKGYRFVANGRYFHGRPAVGRIDVPIIRRAKKALAELEERRIDALPVSLDSGASSDLNRGLGIRIARGPSYIGTVLMLNTRRPPFDRADARRAVARALDLGRIARTLSTVPGERPAAPAERGYLHPGSPWAAARDLHRFEPDAARVAVAELGLPPLRVLAPRDDPVQEQAGRQVVLALERVGVQARLRTVSPSALSAAVGEDRSSPSFQAAIWTAPALASYDPSFLAAVFGGRRAPLNYSGYASASFQRLLGRQADAMTPRARRAAVRASLGRLAADAPVVPLFFADGAYGYRSSVYDGWVFVRGSGIFDKQSFLGHGAARPAADDGPSGGPVGDPLDRADADDSGFALGPFGALALALLAGALLYGGWIALRRSRH